MPDRDPDDEPDDPGLRELEQLLRELDTDDLEPVAPPAAVWAGIDAATRAGSAPAPRPRRPASTWLLVAAAVLVAVVGTTALLRRDRGDEPVVSAASLEFDAATFDPRGAEASARAELVDRSGRYEIRLSDLELPSISDDDLELWLIEPDETGNPLDVEPVSVLRVGGSQTYEIPGGLDPTSHYVVDISIEPRDGDATHSGHSILRGALVPV